MKINRVIAAVIAGLFILPAVSVASIKANKTSNWNSWRGNNNRTSYVKTDDYVLPLLSFDWKVSIGNRFCVHPVTWNKKVFVGNSNNFYALDNTTGSIIWRYKGDYRTTHTPSFQGESIYLSHQNKSSWNIISLDGNNGKLENKQSILSEPTFTLSSGEEIYYSHIREQGDKRYSQYYKQNIKTGKIAWFKRFPGEYTFDCMDDGILFIRNAVYEKGNDYPPGNIYAIDETDGDILWELDSEKMNGSFDGHLIAENGVLYVGMKSEKSGYIKAFHADTGELLWSYESSSTVATCKALSGDRLLVADDYEGLFCLDTKTGDLLWSTGDEQMPDCQIAVTDHLIYICYPDSELASSSNPKMNSRLASLDITNGDTLYTEKFQHTPQAMAIDSDRLFISTEEGILYSYKRKIALVGIIVSPTRASLYPGGQIQFNYTNYDTREKEIKNLDVTWDVSPSELGKISKTGLFTAGNGDEKRGIITATHGEILGSAVVTICKSPELKFEKIDFGLMKKGETRSLKAPFKDDLFCDGKLEVADHPEWLEVEKPLFDPVTEVIESKITVITDTLVPGFYTGVVQFDIDIGMLELEVSVEVVGEDQDIISTDKTTLDFGLLKSWETKNLEKTFTIISTLKNKVVCSVETKSDWLTVYPVYSEVGKSLPIQVSCISEKIKPGETLSAEIIIKPDVGKEISLQVTVKKLINTTLVLSIDSPIAILDNSEIELDVPPQIISGRTMVPIRVISESMGAEVDWIAEERRIDITLTSLDETKRVIKMWVNKSGAEIDGKQIQLDSPPTVVSGRTLVPVRFISEAFGAKVNWSAQERAVTITYTP